MQASDRAIILGIALRNQKSVIEVIIPQLINEIKTEK